jgi:hypothetical protein
MKIDLLQFNMSIRALLDTGATTSTLGSTFADKVKVGREESARQFHGSTMKLFPVDKSLEIHLGDFYQETAFKLASESPYAMVLGMEWNSKIIKIISMENWRIKMESGRFKKLTSSQNEITSEFLSQFKDFFDEKKKLQAHSEYDCKILVTDKIKNFKTAP